MTEERAKINMFLGDALKLVEKSLSAKPEKREYLLKEAADTIQYVIEKESEK